MTASKGVGRGHRFTEPLPLRLIEGARREGECLVWQGGQRDGRYGTIIVGSRSDGTMGQARVHRAAYACWVGSFPSGWDVHHRCGRQLCIEPSHLEAMPHSEHSVLSSRR
jgi:hypothetical protein